MKRGITTIVALAILASGGFYWYTTQPVAEGSTALQASGTIEAKEVAITAEVGGRVIEITADEGSEVKANHVLVQLDEDLIASQIEQAKAAVKVAEAALAEVRAGSREEEIRLAEADLDKSKAARDGALATWEDAVALRDNPQELNAQIDAEKTQVKLAQSQIEGWQVDVETVQRTLDKYEWDKSTEGKTAYRVASSQMTAARAGLKAAQETLAGAERNLENLLEMRDNPLEANAAVDATWWAYQTMEAGVQAAEAQLASIEAGPTTEEVAVAQAQVVSARTAMDELSVYRDKMRIPSPINGMVTSRSVHLGEMALPGIALMMVANLEEVELVVYIPTDQIGWVKVGNSVQVRVDTYPEREYPGQVTYISPQAEFTPKNVQTKEERVNTVFAVKIRLANPAHELKPGMPADAYFQDVP